MSRPGVMLYFDMRPALALLTDEERGRFLSAIFDYAEMGVLPEFEGALAMAWMFVKPKIDRDGERYENTCLQRKYAVYCRETQKAGGEPKSFEIWKEAKAALL